MSNVLAIVTGAIQEAREDFSRVLVDRSINFEREAGFAIQQLQRTDFSMSVAAKNRQSVINAVTNIAAIGISLNPARKQAYLVPRDQQICLDISYIGLTDIAVSSGSVLWAQAHLVRSNDVFRLVGMDKQPIHEFEPFGTNRGDIIGAYVTAKLHNGDYLTTMMDLEELYSIRARSDGWKAYVGKKIKSTPWATDEGEMMKKTVIRRAYKSWPKTDRMDRAMEQLDQQDKGIVNGDQPDDFVDVAPMIAEALATKSDEEALAYWRANNARLAKQPTDHKRLKEEISRHRASLRESTVIENGDTGTPRAGEARPQAPDAEFLAGLDRGAQQQAGDDDRNVPQ
jgi:recombination protein RecT